LTRGFSSIKASTTAMTEPVPTAMTSYCFIHSLQATMAGEPLSPLQATDKA
jgi:hypothetical protein